MKVAAMVLMAAFTMFAGTASVQAADPIACALTFQAKGGGVQIIVGDFVMHGRGEIRCTSKDGKGTITPVKVTLGGYPVSLNVGMGEFAMRGAASGLGFVTSPSDLMGDYLIANGQGAFIGGAGASVAFRADSHNASLNVSLELVHGIGFDAGLNILKIRPDHSRMPTEFQTQQQERLE